MLRAGGLIFLFVMGLRCTLNVPVLVFFLVCPDDISAILWAGKLKLLEKSEDMLWQKQYFYFLIHWLIDTVLNYYRFINYLFVLFLIWAISQAPFEQGSWYLDTTVNKRFWYKVCFWFIDELINYFIFRLITQFSKSYRFG